MALAVWARDAPPEVAATGVDAWLAERAHIRIDTAAWLDANAPLAVAPRSDSPVLAAALLHERVPASMVVATAVVVGCVAGAKYFSRGMPAPRAE